MCNRLNFDGYPIQSEYWWETSPRCISRTATTVPYLSKHAKQCQCRYPGYNSPRIVIQGSNHVRTSKLDCAAHLNTPDEFHSFFLTKFPLLILYCLVILNVSPSITCEHRPWISCEKEKSSDAKKRCQRNRYCTMETEQKDAYMHKKHEYNKIKRCGVET